MLSKKQNILVATGFGAALTGAIVLGATLPDPGSNRKASVPAVTSTSPLETPTTPATPNTIPPTIAAKPKPTHTPKPKKSTTPPKPAETTPVPPVTTTSELVALVDSIKNEPQDQVIPKYSRAEFGNPAPTSATRAKLVAIEERVNGTWLSLWDGKSYTSASGQYMEADHTVALAEAWRSGAFAWSQEKREAYANDLNSPYTLNLITASLNQTKGDKDPFDWMPPLNQCEYIHEWAAIKVAWGLTADGEEKMAMHNRALTCSE